MGFMGMFGGKKTDSAVTGDWGDDMVGMMKMLAGMPHMMRKPMMKGRINQLLSLSEEKRQESIRDMIGAFHNTSMKEKTREKLVATRVEIVAELPEEKRRTMIASRLESLKVAPQLEQADRGLQQRAMTHLSPGARAAFTSTWDQLNINTGG